MSGNINKILNVEVVHSDGDRWWVQNKKTTGTLDASNTDNQVPTSKAVYTTLKFMDDNSVHLTGDEVISGNKTITGDVDYTGVVSTPTPPLGDISNLAANTEFVQNALNSRDLATPGSPSELVYSNGSGGVYTQQILAKAFIVGSSSELSKTHAALTTAGQLVYDIPNRKVYLWDGTLLNPITGTPIMSLTPGRLYFNVATQVLFYHDGMAIFRISSV